MNDLTIVLTNFGERGEWSQGAMDGTLGTLGTVDINDLTIVLANFGTTYGASSGIEAVPEPSTIALFLVSAACLLAFAWRKRREEKGDILLFLLWRAKRADRMSVWHEHLGHPSGASVTTC